MIKQECINAEFITEGDKNGSKKWDQKFYILLKAKISNIFETISVLEVMRYVETPHNVYYS